MAAFDFKDVSHSLVAPHHFFLRVDLLRFSFRQISLKSFFLTNERS